MSDHSIDIDLFLQNQGYSHPQAVIILIEEYYGWLNRLMKSLLPHHVDISTISQVAMQNIAITLADYQPGTSFVITSYSIHYTKLYEFLIPWLMGAFVGAFLSPFSLDRWILSGSVPNPAFAVPCLPMKVRACSMIIAHSVAVCGDRNINP